MKLGIPVLAELELHQFIKPLILILILILKLSNLVASLHLLDHCLPRHTRVLAVHLLLLVLELHPRQLVYVLVTLQGTLLLLHPHHYCLYGVLRPSLTRLALWQAGTRGFLAEIGVARVVENGRDGGEGREVLGEGHTGCRLHLTVYDVTAVLRRLHSTFKL